MLIRPISFLPRSRSKVVFALVMACYGIVLTHFVNTLLRAANTQGPPSEFYLGLQHPVLEVFLLILFAPVLESLILIGAFEFVRYARGPDLVKVFAAAWVVGLLHTRPWPLYGIIVFPTFCVQAASYLYWRRDSWKVGFSVVALIHALGNVIPAISVIGYALRHA